MKMPKPKAGSSQYKTNAYMLYRWLIYATAPSQAERELSEHLASSISLRISRYCWPEARGLGRQWKKLLVLQEEYMKAKQQSMSTGVLIPLHSEITELARVLIKSFVSLHNRLCPDAPESGEPMPLNNFMKKCCEPTSEKSRNKFKKSLQKAHRDKKINLPKVGQRNSGQPQQYDACALFDNWS